jgi:hypothetical protein
MLATLTDAPFDDAGWIFEDKYDGFRMVAKIEDGKFTEWTTRGEMRHPVYLGLRADESNLPHLGSQLDHMAGFGNRRNRNSSFSQLECGFVGGV